jgi:hypothetical protein
MQQPAMKRLWCKQVRFVPNLSAFGHSFQGLGKQVHMKMLPAIVDPTSPHRPATMNGPVIKRKETRDG